VIFIPIVQKITEFMFLIKMSNKHFDGKCNRGKKPYQTYFNKKTPTESIWLF